MIIILHLHAATANSLAGAAGGGALSYARHSSSTVEALQRRRMQIMYDVRGVANVPSPSHSILLRQTVCGSRTMQSLVASLEAC